MCCFHHSLRTSDTKKSKNIRVWRCDVAPTGRILENPLTAPSWPMHIISAQVFSVMRNYQKKSIRFRTWGDCVQTSDVGFGALGT